MAVTYAADSLYRRGGTNNFGVSVSASLDSSYPTGGYTINASDFALSYFTSFQVEAAAGYVIQADIQTGGKTAKLKVYSSASEAAATFTGSASALNLATPVFSGTGLTAAGQVITTTDNKTMTLNQCAGLWLISATGATPPNLILSNTAVTGAPAVLTVQGAASTDAGAYKIVGVLPVGTNSATAAAALAEVANGTNLAAVTGIGFSIEGF